MDSYNACVVFAPVLFRYQTNFADMMVNTQKEKEFLRLLVDSPVVLAQ